jgi:hypothetical protein
VLLLEHLDDEQRRAAKKTLRERVMAGDELAPAAAEPKRSIFKLR